jgi:hypothetical protein
MTTIMTDLVSSQRSHALCGLSLTQLEATLVAANLLLAAWQTTTRSDFKRGPVRPRSKESRKPVEGTL